MGATGVALMGELTAGTAWAQSRRVRAVRKHGDRTLTTSTARTADGAAGDSPTISQPAGPPLFHWRPKLKTTNPPVLRYPSHNPPAAIAARLTATAQRNAALSGRSVAEEAHSIAEALEVGDFPDLVAVAGLLRAAHPIGCPDVEVSAIEAVRRAEIAEKIANGRRLGTR